MLLDKVQQDKYRSLVVCAQDVHTQLALRANSASSMSNLTTAHTYIDTYAAI